MPRAPLVSHSGTHSPHTSLRVLRTTTIVGKKGTSSLRYHSTSSRIVIVVASLLLVVSPALCPSWRRSLCFCPFHIRPHTQKALPRPLGPRVHFVEKSSSWVLATGLVCPSLSQSSRLSATTRVRVCAPLRQMGHRHHQRALYGSGQDWTGLSSREHQKVRSRPYGCASHRSVCARPLWSQGTHFIIHSTRKREEIARRLIQLR